jgi:SAM-dependent methyltransferase
MAANPDTGAELRARYAGDGGATAVFTGRVADYVASRPDYPAALFETLKSMCPPVADSVVADVGAGTGLLTKGLLDSGYRVVAVEPNPAMRAAADDYLRKYENFHSVEGGAESLPLAAGSVQLITAAQAFHWFEVERARADFLRVLTPTGLVALIWNDRVLHDPLNAALDEVSLAYGGGKRAAMVAHEERQYVPQFFGGAVPQEFSWPHRQRLSEDGFLSLVFSRSYIPERTTADGEKVAELIREIFHRHAVDGIVEIPYRTVAIIGRPK